MNPLDPVRARRELMRWYLLLAIYHARPESVCEAILEGTIRALYADTTAVEIRQQLDYLAHRELISVRKEPAGRWWAELSSIGVDIVEYTVDCAPGIARPTKYWVGPPGSV
ncbi:hypothetical protein [Accumulibacter sp.]|uniref:hypothetical protein n=1 Tax=Accumulibacter sp. TaxID=2053492 RepID=UPI00287AF53B|nr:hypothetical protein [Accumulibacter sp.]MDS4056450.1 hypothetical protein [Accumulibacter sp.]HMW56388.1 hypothetical protein [Accumulibacter sp.]HMW79182.1 hypothetical protein [Accumulibacter sp.]HNC66169.1 hypothetical protein [Thauera aminoaromatica]